MCLKNLLGIGGALIFLEGCTSPEKNILPEELAVAQRYNTETYICY